MTETIDLTTSDAESSTPRTSTRTVPSIPTTSLDTGIPFRQRLRQTLAHRSHSRPHSNAIEQPNLTSTETLASPPSTDDTFTLIPEDTWKTSDAHRTSQLRNALTQPFAGTVVISSRPDALTHADQEYDILDLTNKLVFWTDGSHKDVGPSSQQGCGIAIVWRAHHYNPRTWLERGFYLSPEYDNHGAEFFAIAEALKYAARMCEEASSSSQAMRADVDTEHEDVKDNLISAVTVYTDSQYALNIINSYHTGEYATHRFPTSRQIDLAKLRERARKLVDMHVSVELRWVPGHAGIEGNTRADRLARRARENVSGTNEVMVPAKRGGLGLVVRKVGQGEVVVVNDVDGREMGRARREFEREVGGLKKGVIEGRVEKNVKEKGKRKKVKKVTTMWNRFARLAHLDG